MLMNLPGLWQLRTKLYFVKSGLKMSLQIPWNVHVLWKLEFWRAVFSATSPACPGSRGLSIFLGWSFPCHSQVALELGIGFVVSFFVTRGDIRRTNPIKPCRGPGIAPGNSPVSFLSSQGLYFFLFECPEKLIWQRSQLRAKGCPPRQLVAPTILSRWCAEDRPGCQKVFNPFFSPHPVDNLRLLLTGMLPENHFQEWLETVCSSIRFSPPIFEAA